ncbi:MAG: hypothetical protein M3383_04920 [Actinomycetota bacterium]|nr:hypothetical protein [Actinomycetota bacterium]
MALIATGCGDDDADEGDDSATPTESTEAPEEPAEPVAPTKKEYIAEADAICKKANNPEIGGVINDNLAGLSSATTIEAQSASASAAAKGFLKLADLRDATTKKLTDLAVPPEGGAKEFLRSRERNTQAMLDWAKALEKFANDPSQESVDAAGAAGTRSNELAAENEKIAERYGLKECGQRTSSKK